ncbi:MAG: hypothetical protein ABI878_13390 [Acidobacteriota bacterium]
MAFVRGQKLAMLTLSVVAVLSLLAGSVSACTCSHHEEKAKTERPSCHSHTHEQAVSPENDSTRSFDAECECLTAKPLPAIVAKSDKKNADLHSESVLTGDGAGVPEFVSVRIASAAISSPQDVYLSAEPYRLLPARAPPRL